MDFIQLYKTKLKGLSKDQKLHNLHSEIISISMSGGSYSKFPKRTEGPESHLALEQLEKLKAEVETNVEAYESATTRKELIPFMYDRDLNWFFNAKNIPAQRNLVMPTYEYFNEGAGKGTFEPIDFLNLLVKQYDDLLKNKQKPFDFVKSLNNIPLSERERHTLSRFILKWFGGYPTANLDEQLNTVLKFVEKEFLSYPEHTVEKEFCSKDHNSHKRFAEAAAHLSADMKGVKISIPHETEILSKHNIPESRYLKKVHFDFGSLPTYVIQKAIVWRFESARMNKDSDYYEWQSKLSDFLNSIPTEYRLIALTKGIEYGQKVYNYHLENECTHPETCHLNETWQRRISLAKDMLGDISPVIIEDDNIVDIPEEKNKDFTTARQVLAIHYLLEYAQIRNVDATEKARFIQFLTGKELGAKNIRNTNIYKKIKLPLSTDEKTLVGDLQFIRGYFEKLGLHQISKAINNEISSRE